jgi:hypothetical protein
MTVVIVSGIANLYVRYHLLLTVRGSRGIGRNFAGTDGMV